MLKLEVRESYTIITLDEESKLLVSVDIYWHIKNFSELEKYPQIDFTLSQLLEIFKEMIPIKIYFKEQIEKSI